MNPFKHGKMRERERRERGAGEPRREEDDGWTRVTSRRSNAVDRSRLEDVTRIATTFFVSDFPRYWSSRDLWKAVDKCGVLVDAFVPRRRGANGSSFGFVRFMKVANQTRLLEQLEKLVFNGIRLKANVSKFPRKSRAQHDVRRREKEVVVGHRVQYEDRRKKKKDVVDNRRKVDSGHMASNRNGGKIHSQGASFRDVLKGVWIRKAGGEKVEDKKDEKLEVKRKRELVKVMIPGVQRDESAW
ncbi:hypothetical protein LXL04_004853 [Taraxacum kok-saghyz]